MDLLEYIWYEGLPYIYGSLSIFAFSQSDVSKLAGIAAIVLAFCSYAVFVKRFEHRTYASKYNNKTRI